MLWALHGWPNACSQNCRMLREGLSTSSHSPTGDSCSGANPGGTFQSCQNYGKGYEGRTRMRERQCWMVITMLLVWTALYLVALRSARSQALSLPGKNAIHCYKASAQTDLKEKMRPVYESPSQCRTTGSGRSSSPGFVGGFIRDGRHFCHPRYAMIPYWHTPSMRVGRFFVLVVDRPQLTKSRKQSPA